MTLHTVFHTTRRSAAALLMPACLAVASLPLPAYAGGPPATTSHTAPAPAATPQFFLDKANAINPNCNVMKPLPFPRPPRQEVTITRVRLDAAAVGCTVCVQTNPRLPSKDGWVCLAEANEVSTEINQLLQKSYLYGKVCMFDLDMSDANGFMAFSAMECR